MLTRNFLLLATILGLGACHKSGTSATQTSSPPSLKGHWTIFKYIAANFDTTGGKTHLPNDTIYPIHSEYIDFTHDSVYSVNWENFVYFFGHPDSFYNVQTREYLDTSAYTATSSYYVEYRFAPYDTSYIISLSDTLLVTKENLYEGTGTNGPVLYNLFVYSRR
jgi:hypothetical protein